MTNTDLNNQNFRWLQAREISVGNIPVIALRLSFSGELAWELHADNQQLDELWDAIWQAGQEYEIGVFGSKAIDSLRMEKFYRGGHELANDVTHKEVGLKHFTKMYKEFIGKQALQARKQSSQCVLLALKNETTECLLGEAVYANGNLAGSITSAAYGFSVGKSLVIAFINLNALKENSEFEISLLGERVKALLLETVPYDPDNHRLKA